MKSRSLFNVLNLALAGGLTSIGVSAATAEPAEENPRVEQAVEPAPATEPTPDNAQAPVTPDDDAAQTQPAFVGIAVAEAPIPPEQAEAAELADTANGLVVSSVHPGSPADQAGLQPGDLLVKLDEQRLLLPVQLQRYVTSLKPGTDVRLTFLRDGKPMTLDLTLGERPAELGRPGAPGAAGARGMLDPRFQGFRFGDGAVLPDLPRLDLQPLDPQRGDMFMPELEAQMEQMRKEMNARLQQLQQQLRDGHAAQPIQPVMPMPDNGAAVQQGFRSVVTTADGEHTLTVTTTPEGKHLKALDAQGEVVFDGPINTAEELDEVPQVIRDKMPKTQLDIPSLDQDPQDDKQPVGRAV